MIQTAVSINTLPLSRLLQDAARLNLILLARPARAVGALVAQPLMVQIRIVARGEPER